MGFYPYEQSILPPVATTLSHSSSKCGGPTPSVQVLSQAMSIIAAGRAHELMRKKSIEGQNMRPADYVTEFATMLKCSYICACAGMAFTNCVHYLVFPAVKKASSASSFSGWFAKLVKIHHSFKFAVSVLSMGTSADDAVKRAQSSFKGIKRSILLPMDTCLFTGRSRYKSTAKMKTSLTSFALLFASLV